MMIVAQTSIITRAPRLGEDLAGFIRDLIIRDGLKDGDRLPTEKVLCEQYGVSRTVVREAIARLQTEGIVAVRQGSGVFVDRPSGHNVFRIGNRRSERGQFTHVYELRLGVEVAAAELAAIRRSDADIALLEGLIGRMIDPQLRPTADTDFHVGIARATKNELYANFVAFLGVELSSVIGDAVVNTINRHPEQINLVIAEHRCILTAIVKRDRKAARRAMTTHLVNAAKRLSIHLE